MRKSLILLLIILLVSLAIYIVLNGFTIGEIEILSYVGIRERDEKLDETIQNASKLAQTDYRRAVSDVDENIRKLKQEKSEYEELTIVSSEGEIRSASQLERYDLETLWVKLGNHATSEGVIIKVDVKNGTSGMSGYYNLQFEVNGSYISITDFISDIENDSTLGFKIEEFNMLPVGDGELRATFTCKDISIDGISQISTSTEQSNDNTTKNNNTTNNTTNNTVNITQTNTTNATNTTNTQSANNTNATEE